MSDTLKNLRCVGLVRCSTNGQIETSNPQQIVLLKKFAAEQKMRWVGVEEVEGVSGSWPGNRLDIERLIDRKRSKDDYDVLLVQDRSRLTRGGQDHGAMLRGMFGRIGVQIVSACSRIAADDPYAWIIEGMEDDASERHVKRLSHDVSRGLQASMQSGKICYARRPPFGVDRLYVDSRGRPLHIIRNLPCGSQLKLDPKTHKILESYPKEEKGQPRSHYRKQPSERVIFVPGAKEVQELIRRIFRQYYLDRIGCRRIAQELNEEGAQAPEGGKWYGRGVECIVTNTIYTGHGIANRRAWGKFHNRSAAGPIEVKVDRWKRLERKRPAASLRPPSDWFHQECAALQNMLDPAVRSVAKKEQEDYWRRAVIRERSPKRRPRHHSGEYFLTGALFSKEDGRSMGGTLNGHRYYRATHSEVFVQSSGSSRRIRADAIETAALDILEEVLGKMKWMRSTVIQHLKEQIAALPKTHQTTESLKKEEMALLGQIRFALGNLSDLGEASTTEVISPLKKKLEAVQDRLRAQDIEQGPPFTDAEEHANRVITRLNAIRMTLRQVPNEVLNSDAKH